MGMFDWLLGDGGKKKEEQRLALENMDIQNAYNREMANGLSGITADPNNAGVLADLTKADPNFTTNWNNQAMGLRAQANSGDREYTTAKEEADKMAKKSRYDVFGNGMLGAILNPIAQTASGGYDLLTGNYGKNDRDVMSDLGALGETALTVIPGLGLAGKGATLGVKGMAATGGAFGAADALRQGGSDTNIGDVLGQAGTGALFGGGIGLAGSKLAPMIKGRGATNITGRYLADPANANASRAFIERGMLPNLKQQVMKQPNFLGDYGSLYGNAMKSMIPKSTMGRMALGAGGLYGGMKLLGGGGQPQPNPYDEQQMMMNGGYGGMQ